MGLTHSWPLLALRSIVLPLCLAGLIWASSCAAGGLVGLALLGGVRGVEFIGLLSDPAQRAAADFARKSVASIRVRGAGGESMMGSGYFDGLRSYVTSAHTFADAFVGRSEVADPSLTEEDLVRLLEERIEEALKKKRIKVQIQVEVTRNGKTFAQWRDVAAMVVRIHPQLRIREHYANAQDSLAFDIAHVMLEEPIPATYNVLTRIGANPDGLHVWASGPTTEDPDPWHAGQGINALQLPFRRILLRNGKPATILYDPRNRSGGVRGDSGGPCVSKTSDGVEAEVFGIVTAGARVVGSDDGKVARATFITELAQPAIVAFLGRNYSDWYRDRRNVYGDTSAACAELKDERSAAPEHVATRRHVSLRMRGTRPESGGGRPAIH
jgi:hypothetical protein